MNIRAFIYRLLGYKTIEELMQEMKDGKRQTIGGKTLDNARKLGDALLPNNLKFPVGGEIYESTSEVAITYMTSYHAPFTGGDKTTLPAGVKVIVHKPNSKRPTGVYCTPLDYEKFEDLLIPKDETESPNYAGYHLSVDTVDLNKQFKQIDTMCIKYLQGDATSPIDTKTKIIVHICNDVGGWGKGFVLAVSKKWKQPEIEYRNWYKSKELDPTDNVQYQSIGRKDKYTSEKKFELGNVQFVKVADDIWVANLLAQRDTKPDKDGLPPIRYVFVSEGLERVKEFAKQHNASVHMPRIGCGLAGGQWTEIEPIINEKLLAYDIETTVYDFG